MNLRTQELVIQEILQSIEIPDSAYEKAEKRYEDLGTWFARPASSTVSFQPYIYSHGSFRLGTVIRPLNSDGYYDLDVACRLRAGIDKLGCTQESLKRLIGVELEAYRVARNFDKNLEEKNRCWRLEYADDLSFHMDVVPSIPEEHSGRSRVKIAMVKSLIQESLASAISDLTGAVTDRTHPQYKQITQDWRISNPEGFAIWFESRMALAKGIEKRAIFEAKSLKIDKIPMRKWNSPLQQCIKILKRHRDCKFDGEEDRRPASIIVTTLASHSYQGEETLESALHAILSKMDQFIRTDRPRVPNPVNPAEDFADKWYSEEGLKLKLEEAFREWLKDAREDFISYGFTKSAKVITDNVSKKFRVPINEAELSRKLGQTSVGIVTSAPNNPVNPLGGGRFG